MRYALFIISVTGLLWGQLIPGEYHLNKSGRAAFPSYLVDSTSTEGLASNGVIDIRSVGDSLLFFGTARGLSMSPDRGATFRSYVADKVDLPEGGISALNNNGNVVAVAGITDTVINGTGEIMGAGLAYSLDQGNTWAYKAQSIDNPGGQELISSSFGGQVFQRLAVTTEISNVTYDVSVSPGYIWTASWAGGVRRLDLATGQWSAIPLPRDNDTTLACDSIPADYILNPRDPIANPEDSLDSGHHNHKGFSVMAYDTLVWVGTAAGLNKGIIDPTTGGITWTHYKAQWGTRSISANWILALHRQITTDGTERIWASTMNTTDPSEHRAVCFTEDNGDTWYVTLLGERSDNITSSGDVVYVATENGLFKSLDGLNWARMEAAVDVFTGEEVWAEKVYGVLLDSRTQKLWVGTPDGLASTNNDGLTWEIERRFVPTGDEGEVRFYAYPNPFYLGEHNYRDGSGHVRFQYHILSTEINRTATVVIYDFAMNPVITLAGRQHPYKGDFSQVWDGRNEVGYRVANGVYYCRLAIGGEKYWTKVMVIK
ncbi:hypothetical protein ACFL5M_03025 [Candidatus Neomarinimicrobiota bacterium]